MTNKEIAQKYAKMMFEMTTDNGVWVSDNLPTLSREDRKMALAVYKSIFPVVEYDAKTGVCKCFKTAARPISITTENTAFFDTGPGHEIKASTIASLK
jgi:hypothetical protein